MNLSQIQARGKSTSPVKTTSKESLTPKSYGLHSEWYSDYVSRLGNDAVYEQQIAVLQGKVAAQGRELERIHKILLRVKTTYGLMPEEELQDSEMPAADANVQIRIEELRPIARSSREKVTQYMRPKSPEKSPPKSPPKGIQDVQPILTISLEEELFGDYHMEEEETPASIPVEDRIKANNQMIQEFLEKDSPKKVKDAFKRVDGFAVPEGRMIPKPVKAKLQDPLSDSSSMTKKDGIVALGDVIGWTTLFKKSHPGSLSHLRKTQRESICRLIKTYLTNSIGDEIANECYTESKNGGTEIGVPESLEEDFLEWFDEQLDRGVMGGKTKYAIPANIRPGNYVEPTPPPPIQIDGTFALGNPVGSKGMPIEIDCGPEKESVYELSKVLFPSSEAKMMFLEVVVNEYRDVMVESAVLKGLMDTTCLLKDINRESIIEAFETTFQEELIIRSDAESSTKRKLDDFNNGESKRPKSDDTPAQALNSFVDYIRYTLLLQEVNPEFQRAEVKLRVTLKKKVKHWLKQKLGADFPKSVVITTNGTNKEHQTFTVPRKDSEEFKKWAGIQMKELGFTS